MIRPPHLMGAFEFVAVSALRAAHDAPVSPNATPQVHALLDFLDRISGQYILSGQQEIAWDESRKEEDFDYILQQTGKVPAVRGFDFLQYVYSPSVRANQHATERAIAWSQNGGIVTFCCHMFMDIGSPARQPQFYVPSANNGVGTTFDIRQAVIAGTPENTEYLAKLDIIAEELTKLRDTLVSDEELGRAKEHLIGVQSIGLQRNGARAGTMALDACYGLGADAYLRYPAEIATVTPEDVREAARRVIDFERSALTVVGP